MCCLLALLPVLLYLRVVYLWGGFRPALDATPDPGRIVIFFGGFALTTLCFAWLATTGRSSHQWIGWSIAWAVQLVLISALLPDLAPVDP